MHTVHSLITYRALSVEEVALSYLPFSLKIPWCDWYFDPSVREGISLQDVSTQRDWRLFVISVGKASLWLYINVCINHSGKGLPIMETMKKLQLPERWRNSLSKMWLHFIYWSQENVLVMVVGFSVRPGGGMVVKSSLMCSGGGRLYDRLMHSAENGRFGMERSKQDRVTRH